jgi:cell division protease FtsH
MVMRFGMSDKLGPRVFGHDHGQPFLGRRFQMRADYSSDVAREIDEEIRSVIEAAHDRARRTLEAHRDQLDRLAEMLLRRETIEREQFIELLDDKSEEELFRDEPSPGRKSRRQPRVAVAACR